MTETTDRLEKAIAELESTTSAEVVISFARSSGRYSDVDLLWGMLLALAALGAILWSPWHFHEDYVVLNVLLIFGLAWLLSRKIPALRRSLTSARRREAQVEDAARVEFLKAGVDQTAARTGLLIYVSRLERRLAILPDRGVEQSLDGDILSGWRSEYGASSSLDALLESLPRLLAAMKAPLARDLPRGADDVNELGDRPLEVLL